MLSSDFLMENIDLKILSGIIDGDKKAFDLLFSVYYDKLCRYADKMVHDDDQCEDLVQDLFAEIWVNRKKLSIKTSLSAYLYRSIYNSCLDQIKHQKVKNKHQSETVFQSVNSFDDSLVFTELIEKMEKCIENLPDQCKKIFRLSRFENLKYREIAEVLQVSENTVDTQIRRALNKLKEELKDYLITILFLLPSFFL